LYLKVYSTLPNSCEKYELDYYIRSTFTMTLIDSVRARDCSGYPAAERGVKAESRFCLLRRWALPNATQRVRLSAVSFSGRWLE
jgi:hypothetical protein